MLRHDCIDTMLMPVAGSGKTNGWKSWFPAGSRLLVLDTARVFVTLSQWQRRHNWRIRLSDTSDHLLKDMGISPEEALRESQKPFWRT